MRQLLFVLLRILVRLSDALYQGEGVNATLMFMPTKMIAPVLRERGARIGDSVRFLAPLTVHGAASKPDPYYHNLSVGSNCYFGRGLFLDLQDRIVVEDNVTVSHRVTILTHTDVGDSPLKDGPFQLDRARVSIRRGAYVGAGAMVLPGVEIGECAVVGAGAVVTKDVPAHSVVAGVPARVMRTLDSGEEESLKSRPTVVGLEE